MSPRWKPALILLAFAVFTVIISFEMAERIESQQCSASDVSAMVLHD